MTSEETRKVLEASLEKHEDQMSFWYECRAAVAGTDDYEDYNDLIELEREDIERLKREIAQFSS